MDEPAGRNAARILVVEDELLIAQGLVRRLEKLGYAVTGIATSGQEAVDRAACDLPALVMMDIVIQGEIDGIAAAQRIYRELDIPVVFVTAYADEETLQAAERAGAYGYVLKPYRTEEVSAAIRLALCKHSEVRRLSQEASTDALTGLLNRRAWLDLAQREFHRWRRYGDAFAVLMLDIDRFKQINDALGHAVGDAALKAVSTSLLGTLRHVDCVGRLGGDEFVVLLPSTPSDEAGELAERVRAGVATPQGALLQDGLQLTVSIGVAAPQASDESLQAVLERADQGLYLAKSQGRNRVGIS